MAGVPCPICENTLSDVYDSRPAPGTVIRKRKCIEGHTFETREFVIGKVDPPTPRAGKPKSVLIRAMLAQGKSIGDISEELSIPLRYVRTYANERSTK